MNKRGLILAIVALGLVCNGLAQSSHKAECAKIKTYQNPVFEPDLADPTFVRASDGWFYAYGTENTWEKGDHKVVPIVKSPDLINWQYVGEAFEHKPSWKPDGGIWAPCIVAKNNQYYLYYSFSTWGDPNAGVGVAVSDKPEGPFVDLGKIFDSESIGVHNSIDPFFVEANDSQYLIWGSFFGVYGVEIAPDMKTVKGEKFKITGNAFEAVYIYPRDGKFFLLGSNGSCCEGVDSKYRVTVAVADNLKGPYYTKDGQAIINDGQEGTPFLYGDANAGWVGPGHNAEIITDDEGSTFILYHAVDVKNGKLANGATRRPLLMDQVLWDSDGWPYIENNVASNIPKKAPVFKHQTQAK